MKLAQRAALEPAGGAFLRLMDRTFVAEFSLLGLHLGSGLLPVFVRPTVGPTILFPKAIGSITARDPQSSFQAP